jgi:anti-sigma regulatory factor (Ser/Thr protein kinase)
MYVGQIPRFAMDVDLDGIALAPMRDSLSAWLTEVGVHEEPRRAVVLAAHEAAATAVMHATAPQVIHVSTTLLDEHVLVEVANRPTDLVVAASARSPSSAPSSSTPRSRRRARA